ncbi:integrin beta-1-B-like [Conger conger]|uniref:integrin beta-1-B-like n=1 Tax=Conger conger TaxID=82655 RepID=UPI002A5A6EF9|nr:integrin beta-1-B-like [Conger conger]
MKVSVVVLLLCCWDSTKAEQGEREQGCHASGAQSCDECLASGPRCAWCSEESFIGPGQFTWERCDTVSALVERGCPSGSIEDPRGDTALLLNHKITSRYRDWNRHVPHTTVQLQPQKVLMRLRPGEPQTFKVKFKRVEGYPIDLYYLMDLSFSMEDDLLNVKQLGTDLMEEMRNITRDFRMGFGAFVDKTVMPYISTIESMLQNPCKRQEPQACAPAFSFRHVLSFTRNGSLFSELVGRQNISGNLDSPEGGLDALMQVAACEEAISWRNVTRLLVFSTDAGFHFAGDGKLGGIVLPNDGKCHLENNMYTMSNHHDYPSLAHVANKLKQKNIQTIFAVTQDVQHLYEGLKGLFPKCAVGTLSNNSHNILQLIVDAYNALTSEVIMDNSKMPEGYQIAFSSSCKDHVLRTGEEGRKCSNISIGDEVSFQVSITATGCEDGGGEARVFIKPQGFSEEVEVVLQPVCQCNCSQDRLALSPSCNSKGVLECGACRCEEGHTGTFCECDENALNKGDMTGLCRRDNASEVCSGHGDCVCGECVCHKSRRNPDHVYYEKYCQCDNFRCDQYQGLLCGGRGTCECGVCQCFPGFSGSACECALGLQTCLSRSGLLCSGRGHCVCGTCVCDDSRFQGPTCEICPSCPDLCTEHRECVLCHVFRQDFGQKCDRDCSHLNIIVTDQLQENNDNSFHRCKEKDTDGCWVHFLYWAEHRDQPALIHVANERECPAGPDVVLITALVSGSVVLLGLVLLLVWKLFATIHDRREFARFQKELGKAKWDMDDNPIYKSAITTVHNPKYKAQ